MSTMLATTKFLPKEKNMKKKYTRKSRFTNEEAQILNNLEMLKEELDFLYTSLDHVTDQALIDGYIYQIKAVHVRYNFYLNLCKEHKLNNVLNQILV